MSSALTATPPRLSINGRAEDVLVVCWFNPECCFAVYCSTKLWNSLKNPENPPSSRDSFLQIRSRLGVNEVWVRFGSGSREDLVRSQSDMIRIECSPACH